MRERRRGGLAAASGPLLASAVSVGMTIHYLLQVAPPHRAAAAWMCLVAAVLGFLVGISYVHRARQGRTNRRWRGISIASVGFLYAGYVFIEDSPGVLAAVLAAMATMILTAAAGLIVFGPNLFTSESQ